MTDQKFSPRTPFNERFPSENESRLYLEGRRWEEGVRCGHCGSAEVAECRDHQPMPYRCKSCRKHFSVRTGTVLAESRLPLHKWLMAIDVLTADRGSVSFVQVAEKLKITQKSATLLTRRIHETWSSNKDKLQSGGDAFVKLSSTFDGSKKKPTDIVRAPKELNDD